MFVLIISQSVYYEEMSRRGSYLVFGGGYEAFVRSEDKVNSPVGFVGIRILRTDDPRAYFMLLAGGGYSFTSKFWHGSAGLLYERRTQRYGGRFSFHLGIGILGGYYSWDEKNNSPVIEFPVRASFSVRFSSFEIMPEISVIPLATTNMNTDVMVRGVLFVFYGPNPSRSSLRGKERRRRGKNKAKTKMILLYDAFWIFLFNIVGFASHSTLNLDSAFRFLITYVATLTFWYIPTLLLSLHRNPFKFREILLSSAISVPWAITLRALILQRTIPPIFIPVMFLFFFVFALFFRWVYSRLFASS